MLKPICDICHQEMDASTEHLSLLRHGAQILEIKIGINQAFRGDQCTNCTREILKLVAEKGIFVGRRITLPEDIKAKVEEVKEKVSWSLR